MTWAAPTCPGRCGATGNVVMRKSLRSFVKHRSATTEIGLVAVNANVPWNPSGALKGSSLRNEEICWSGPSTNELDRTRDPAVVYKEKLITLSWLFGFAIAIPVVTG